MPASALARKTCTPCQGNMPPLTEAEARVLHKDLPAWELRDAATKLFRRYTFRNFAEAFSVVGKVADIAEAEDHHPDIAFGWGYAEITLFTHKIKGLHENDFIVAAKIEASICTP